MALPAKLERLLPEELKPYLAYSVGAHLVLALLAARIMAGLGGKPAASVYTIDFVGPSATVLSSRQSLEPDAPRGPAAAARVQQQDTDEFGRRRKKGPFVLPRPSLLRGFQAPDEAKPAAALAPAALAADSGGGEAGVSADMPNFPYPWYISQVRASLWNLWSVRMPRAGGLCVVVFSLLPDGRAVDIRAEESSGDAAFDLVALGVVQDSGPYPPLPRGFSEPFLRVHVSFKSK